MVFCVSVLRLSVCNPLNTNTKAAIFSKRCCLFLWDGVWGFFAWKIKFFLSHLQSLWARVSKKLYWVPKAKWLKMSVAVENHNGKRKSIQKHGISFQRIRKEKNCLWQAVMASALSKTKRGLSIEKTSANRWVFHVDIVPFLQILLHLRHSASSSSITETRDGHRENAEREKKKLTLCLRRT